MTAPMVCVPVEPTEAMIEAICAAHTSYRWPLDYDARAQGVRRKHAAQGYAAAIAAAPSPQPVQGEAVRWIVRGARCDDDFRGEDAARRYAKAVGGTVIPLYPQPPVERLVGHDHAGLYEELREAIDNGHESMTHLDALAWVEESHSMREIKPTPAVQIAAPGDVEKRARELLAAEYEASDPDYAEVLREGTELLGGDYPAIRAISAALRSQGQADAVDAKDAARYRWLRRHYGSVNFDPIDHDGMDLVFSVPRGEVSANCDKTIDSLAALAQQANKEQP